MLDSIYDYPVMLSSEDIKNYLGLDCDMQTLYAAYTVVYDILIYPTLNESIKRRIIEKYREKLEKPLKKALLAQYKYITHNGNVADWSGLSGGMTADSKETQEILTKIIAPSVINILKGASIDILYAGG